MHSGGPDQIISSLRADGAITAADELVVVLPFGHSPAVSRRILETVAEIVLPGLSEARCPAIGIPEVPVHAGAPLIAATASGSIGMIAA